MRIDEAECVAGPNDMTESLGDDATRLWSPQHGEAAHKIRMNEAELVLTIHNGARKDAQLTQGTGDIYKGLVRDGVEVFDVSRKVASTTLSSVNTRSSR